MMTEFLVEVHIGTERKRHEQDYKALTFGSFCADAFPNAFLATLETSLEHFGAKYIYIYMALSVCKFFDMTICRTTSLP